MRPILSTSVLVLGAVVALFSLRPAQAHFVWAYVPEGSANVQISFAEDPSPGTANLIDRLKPTQAWLHVPGQPVSELKLHENVDQAAETATLDASVPQSGAYAVEVFCRYGVFAKTGKPLLLDYYAKHLSGDWTQAKELAQPSSRLAFDVVPRLADGGITLQALWKEAPAAGVELTLWSPSGDEQKLTTDEQGLAKIKRAAAGEYHLLAKHVDESAQGELDGKAYNGNWSFATVTFHVADTTTASTASTTSELAAATEAKPEEKDITASELLARARADRALWQDFHGFTADVKVHIDNQLETGTIEIDENGKSKFVGIEKNLTPLLRQQLSSMIAHRLPDSSIGDEADYQEESGLHVLGRKLKLAEESMGSIYRIQDDVVTEVNREMGNQKFTISMLDVEHNAEGKYLPKVFNVSFWDAKSGDLASSMTYYHKWERVGKYDLPALFVLVSAGKDKREVLKIEMSNFRLTDGTKVSSK
ncbi:MAG: DUF3386 family protein [Pirellulales bacterium]|nr:DUF3386 family protein [Pirellulales bacterium]